MATLSQGVSLLALGAYVGIALGVENLYPFSTFPMYSDSKFESGARLVVLSDDGIAREVEDYVGWACVDLAPVETTVCPDGELSQPEGYLLKEAYDYIDAHPPADVDDPTRRDVELVIRTWRLTPGETDVTRLDCPVHRCRARLR